MKRPKRLDLARSGKTVELPAVGNQRRAAHVFERESLLAVNAALDCGRPLLVRGKPGVGKSQLARAVAHELGRVFLSQFIDARTEAHDLMWSHDAVTRLAEAQAWGHRVAGEGAQKPAEAPVSTKSKVAKTKAKSSRRYARGADDVPDPASALARKRYVVPGPLWWAFHWEGARRHGDDAAVKVPPPPYDEETADPNNGVVLLLDEIDKADGSVPNGLLESLGHGEFFVPGLEEPLRATGIPPLVVLTTNDDRVLPDAFVRRCVVLWLRLPDPGPRFEDAKEEDPLVGWLVDRGRAHFGKDAVLERHYVDAAVQVARDRRAVLDSPFCAPGLAEYIDLLAALGADPSRSIADLSRFFLHKHVDPERRG